MDQNIEQKLASLEAENKELREANEHLTSELATARKGKVLGPELQKLVDAKRAAGLPLEQALEVSQRQLENDRQKKKSAKAE